MAHDGEEIRAAWRLVYGICWGLLEAGSRGIYGGEHADDLVANPNEFASDFL